MIWKYCEMSMNVVVVVLMWTTIFGLQYYWFQLLYRARNDVVCHGTRCSSRNFFGESLQHSIIVCNRPVEWVYRWLYPSTNVYVSCDAYTMEDFVVLLVSEIWLCVVRHTGMINNCGFGGTSSINCSAWLILVDYWEFKETRCEMWNTGTLVLALVCLLWLLLTILSITSTGRGARDIVCICLFSFGNS